MSFISAISNRMIDDLLIDYDHDNVCSIKHQSTQFLFGQQQQQLVCKQITHVILYNGFPKQRL